MPDRDNEFRVEARLGGAGRGLNATPEAISELRERQELHEKLSRRPPAGAFARVMAQREPVMPVAPAPETLPKQRPAPGLRRPAEQSAYGTRKKIVLKA